MVGVGRLRGIVIGTAFGHPLTPFVVGHEGKGEDDKGEDGEGELHKDRCQGSGVGVQRPEISGRASWGRIAC